MAVGPYQVSSPCYLQRLQILSQSLSLLFLHFPFIWCQNPGESFELGEHPSQATMIPWQYSYGQWCTSMGSPIWDLYRCNRAKRCLSSQERYGWCPTPSPNSPASLQNSLSLLFLLTIFYMTLSLSAKPLHHTDSSFGNRVRGNCCFWLDSNPKVIISWLFVSNSHTALGSDLFIIDSP
jgi:hypothetical protein